VLRCICPLLRLETKAHVVEVRMRRLHTQHVCSAFCRGCTSEW